MAGAGATRVVVTGASGRMGAEIIRAVAAHPGATLVGASERPASARVGLDVGLALGIGALDVAAAGGLDAALEGAAGGSAGAAQVVIDFTSAEASAAHARRCAEAGVALVVGSTGFDAATEAEVRAAAARVPVVMAPNMSVSVNLCFRLARQAAEVLGPDYEAEILEIHHHHKRDAPSGTALRLGEEVAAARGAELGAVAQHGRHGHVGARESDEIGIHALRGGDVVGEHTVFFFGQGDRVELTHRATSRDAYARGAVRAARWVVSQAPGLYDMQDVLGLR